MNTNRLFLSFLFSMLSCGVMSQNVYLITTTSSTYEPNERTIQVGDKIRFSASRFHPLQEVVKADWDLDNPVPKPNGFECTEDCDIAFETAGEYYFVCTNHVGNHSMKGKVIVQNPLGTKKPTAVRTDFTIYPNPASSRFKFQLKEAEYVQNVSITDAFGNEVESIQPNAVLSEYTSELNSVKPGLYQVIITTSNKRFFNKLVIE